MDDDDLVPPKGRGIARDVVSEEAFLLSEKEGKPNFGMLVLEIGRWAARRNFPEYPPEWAIEACRRYDKKRWTSTRKVITKQKGPGETPGDGETMELVADIFADPLIRRQVGLGGEMREIPLDEKVFAAALRARKMVDRDGNVRRSDLKRIRDAWEADGDYRMEEARNRYAENHAKRMGRILNGPNRE